MSNHGSKEVKMSPYDKNFTDNGYLMNYEKGVNVAPFKNRVLQFKIELPEI